MGRFRRAPPAAVGLCALLLLALPAAARAQVLGFRAYAEAGYINTTGTSVDATGRSSRSDSVLWPQTYRLTWDNTFYPFLALNVAGLYQWNPGTTTVDGLETQTSNNLWNVNARLTIGPPVLSLTPFYTMQQEFISTRLGGVFNRSPTLVRESFGAFAGWTPDSLPAMNLRYSRTLQHDSGRVLLDNAVDEVVFTANYAQVKNVQLQYLLRWDDAQDRINQVETSEVLQSLQATWTDAFFERRLITYLSYNVSWRHATTAAIGSSGTVSTPRIPVAGLSLIEVFPSVPTKATLVPNPALIDGNTTASAGLDVGYAPSLAGDRAFRHIGAQFADALTPVNSIYVWVDRALPASVWSTYSWAAYQSNDNIDWTPIPLAGPVAFGAFDNRFEIPIAETSARYLKVVVRPLAAGITVDPLYADIFVTEIQLFQVVPVTQASRTVDQTAGILTGTARLVLLRTPSLSYDFSGTLAHEDVFHLRSWSITNGLSYFQQLTRVWGVGGRVERIDSGQAGRPSEAVTRWSASVSAEPIPAAAASLIYSGQYQQYIVGNAIQNGFTLVARAELYQGVSLGASAGYTYLSRDTGRNSSGPTWGVIATVTPHQTIVFTGNYSANVGREQGGGLPDVTLKQSILQGTASFSPVPAFFFSVGASRILGYTSTGPSTLANLAVGLSPFPGGDLLLRFGYNESLEGDSRLRFYGPGLRWNIRPGTFLDTSYVWNDTTQPALTSHSQTFFVRLTVSLK